MTWASRATGRAGCTATAAKHCRTATQKNAPSHLSVGDATPPLAITLMQWAPFRSSSLAARRTCKGCGLTCRVGGRRAFERRLGGTAVAAWLLPNNTGKLWHRHRQRRTSGTPSHTLPMPRSAAPHAQKSSPLHATQGLVSTQAQCACPASNARLPCLRQRGPTKGQSLTCHACRRGRPSGSGRVP